MSPILKLNNKPYFFFWQQQSIMIINNNKKPQSDENTIIKMKYKSQSSWSHSSGSTVDVGASGSTVPPKITVTTRK